MEQGSLPGTISEHNLLAAFGKSMKLRSREFPCFGSGIMSSDEWWGQVVRATYSGAGVRQSDLDGVFDEVFLELFHEVFTGTSAWELVPVSGAGTGFSCFELQELFSSPVCCAWWVIC